MEKEMELTAENNWGDKMISDIGRPRCPKCGAGCDDDGDRYYTDICWECGWQTNKNKANSRFNIVRDIEVAFHQAKKEYQESLGKNDIDWAAVANRLELAIEIVRLKLNDREKRLYGDE